MGRPPHGGGPAFRFTSSEVIEMEACLQEISKFNYSVPSRETICAFAEKFSASNVRAGKIVVQPKQVLNWFQNRRYAHRTKVKEPAKLSTSPMPRDDAAQFRNVAPPVSVPQGRNPLENVEVEFEAKSAKDGAWYDVSAFCSHRMMETGNPEVRIRFTGFGEEDEWINVHKCVRQRSLPCEAPECVAVLPGDLVLCFQEGKEHALYFDAHVLDAQRRRHDVRGCRCRFLVRYDHDQSEEIVSLKKICRRPETDYRLDSLQNTIPSGSADARSSTKDTSQVGLSKDRNVTSVRPRKHRKLIDVSKDEAMTIALPALSQLNVSASMQTGNATESNEDNSKAAQEAPINDSFEIANSVAKPQEVNTEAV